MNGEESKMKKLVALFLVLINIVLLCSCGGNTDSAIIYYGVKTPPKTLDPQLASTVTELTLVKNLYEGLMRKDSSGNIVPAAAVTAEQNGNVYTFTLRNDLIWNDGTPILAEDFVFGIKRALLPETNSPNATSLYIIKNAQAVHSGEKSPSELGVVAKDSKTLVIESSALADDLYEVLSSSVCMPCKKEFFEGAKGKYGMSKETMLSNGSFKLTKWVEEDFAMRLHRSSNYNGDAKALCSAIFLSVDKELTSFQRLQKNKVDIAEIENSEIKKAENENLNIIKIPNTVWLIKFGSGYTNEMRKALISSVVTYNSSVTDYPEGISPALNLYPANFEDNAKVNLYNISLAKSTFKTEINKLSNATLPISALYFEDRQGISEVVKMIAGHWQQNLGAYINISGLSTVNQVKLKENDYSITIYSQEITTPDKIKYAKIFGFKNADNLTENILKGNILPIAYSNTALSFSSSLENINENSTDTLIDFAYVNKIQ